MDVVDKIESAKTGNHDKPKHDIKIESIVAVGVASSRRPSRSKPAP